MREENESEDETSDSEIEEEISEEKEIKKLIFFSQLRKAEKPIEYQKNGFPLLPRFYLNYLGPDLFDINKIMRMPPWKFEEYIRFVPSRYGNEIKRMKEAYDSAYFLEKGELLLLFIQRNEKFGKELGLLK